MASNDGFRYHFGHTTTSLFFYDDDNPILPPGHALPRARLGVLRWRAWGLPNPVLPPNPFSLVTVICSSCEGLIAIRCNDTSMYQVGNPFVQDAARDTNLPRYCDLPVPPTFHYHTENHVVLAVVPSTAFLVVAARKSGDVYTFDTFNSASCLWETYMSRFELRHDAWIVRHSGVSCHRSAYWLLCDSTRVPTHVVRFYFRDDHLPPTSSKASFLRLPTALRVEARMQLGRGMGRVCLVVVSAASSTVELLTLNDRAASSENILASFERFNVEVVDDNAAANGEVASWRQEDKTIVCLEMPRPIRFDSFKVELLFWVHGRVVRLENSTNDEHDYRLTVFPQHVPSSITDGRPHVFSDSLPTVL